MNRIISSLIVICCSVLMVSAQKEEILITLGKTKINKAEFERIYKKNNNNLYNESDKKSPKDYLDLYIDFKLKVIEAENLHMDTNSVFINELAGYRNELAAPYLTDVKFNDEMVANLYHRMSNEVNASHILLQLAENASEEDEAAMVEKINKIREEIVNGADFNEAAAKYSEDPSANVNQGKLGYFTAFQMVVPFEDAAFNTPVGEISQPVRSSFGYHLVKVHDLRKNQGEIQVAHIMKMFPQGINEADKMKLKTQIDSVYDAVLKGADFAEMALKFSDDKRSSAQGGEMPWFSAGRIIPEFSDPAFALKNIGDISQPVESSFGYHIIKKLGHKPVPPFGEAKTEIEQRIKQDPARSITSKKAFIDKLKTEYGFSENKENIEELNSKNIAEETDKSGLILFTIDQKQFDIDAFHNFLQRENIQTGTYGDHYERWIEYEITKLEDSKLEEKYPDFRYLMQEYHDGILLFNISEDKIWNFAVQDSAGLEKYYGENMGKYLWEERFKGLIAVCKSVEIKEKAQKYFAAGMNSDEIINLLNKEGEMIVVNEGAWEKGSHPIIDYFVWNGTTPEHFDSDVTFIRGDKIPPEPKNLNEARGLYISDYQNYLEKNWIKELRLKYKIKVDKKVLKTIPGA